MELGLRIKIVNIGKAATEPHSDDKKTQIIGGSSGRRLRTIVKERY